MRKDLVRKFHDKAISKFTDVSDIITVTDKDDKSNCLGFTYGSTKIYYHDGSECMVIDNGVSEPREIGLYEL